MELLRAAARTTMTRGASDAAVLLLRRALEEPVPGDERAAVLVELGLVETLVDGPAGVAHLSEAYTMLDDDRERARVGMVIARTHVFVSPPGVATDFAAGAAAAVPPGLDDERQGLVALQRITGFMHGLPEAGYRAGPVPEVSGDGDGARMLAAVLGYELLRDGVDRTRAVELARFALARDRLLAVDNGLLWIVAANVLLLADEDLGDFWDRALARAHATGGLFAALSVNLWRGFTQWRRGQLDDAVQSLADATEQQRMWGISDVSATYAAAFTLGVLLDRGDLAEASAGLEAARTLPWVGEGGRLLREGAARLLVEKGLPAEALDLLTAPVDCPEVVNPAWAPWRGLMARALAGLGRVEEAVASRTRRWLSCVGGARPRPWGPPCGCAASCAALPVRRTSARRWDCCPGPGPCWRRPAPSCPSGAPRRSGTPRRWPCSSRPSTPPAPAAPRAVVRDAVAALAQRGHAPVDPSDAPVGLTSRQRRVTDLAAAGLDVNEVAQRLFLTPGTVRAVLDSTTEVAP